MTEATLLPDKMAGPTCGTLEVRFWGVRGTHPVSDPNFSAFGGDTACVEIRCGERLFVIDAGTGIAQFGLALMPQPPREIDLLFSHLHLDHVSGLPFFKPALRGDGVTIRTWCGNLGGESAAAPLNRLFSPPLFPITLDQLPARFVHHGFHAGDTLAFDAGALQVRTCPLKHPSGATGYRFDHGGHSVCYVSDIEHEEAGWPPANLRDFVAGADLVIYDGMFDAAEYPACRGWGHSTLEAGVELCRVAGAKALALFHLHPLHDDAHMHETDRRLAAALPGSFVARQGLVMRYGADRDAETVKPAPAPPVAVDP